jgi:hypothetical protein
MVFEPVELVERLAALIPPPRVNMVRYHGVLAPAARDRAAIVPQVPQPEGAGTGGVCRHGDASGEPARPRAAPTSVATSRGGGIGDAECGPERGRTPPAPEVRFDPADRRRRWIPWAELMRRVFEIDVLECPQCGAALRILAAIHPPETTTAILECLGLPARPPPLGPPEAVPEREGAELDPAVLA